MGGLRLGLCLQDGLLVDDLLQLIIELGQLQVLLGSQPRAQGDLGGIVRVDGPDADLINHDRVRVEAGVEFLQRIDCRGLLAFTAHVLGGVCQSEGIHDSLPEGGTELQFLEFAEVRELVPVLAVKGNDPLRVIGVPGDMVGDAGIYLQGVGRERVDEDAVILVGVRALARSLHHGVGALIGGDLDQLIARKRRLGVEPSMADTRVHAAGVVVDDQADVAGLDDEPAGVPGDEEGPDEDDAESNEKSFHLVALEPPSPQ